MVKDIFLEDEIRYVDKTHQYFNLDNIEYTSVTRLINSIKVPFDREGKSRMMAMRIAANSGCDVSEVQREILSEWEDKKNSSIDKGNFVHNALEQFAINGHIEPSLEKVTSVLGNEFRQYYRYFPEKIIYSHTYNVAGRTDLVLQRQKTKVPVLDFIDYKTNESKGIYYDSIKREYATRNGNDVISEIKHYNNYLLHPFDYLEECNYVIYCLQLSVYAYMAMERLKVKIGRLSILFVDNDFNPFIIPVPFMYQEAKMLCELNSSRKQLPGYFDSQESKMYPMTADQAYQKSDDIEIKDDW